MDSSRVSAVGVATNIYQQQVAVQTPIKDKGKETHVANVAPGATDTVKIETSVTMKNLDTVRVIEQMHAHLNQLAKGVRESNEAINKATDQVDAMKNNLQVVLKNFPPFLVDSKERNEKLMEYTSLRKELISLMVPPPPAPPYEKVKHMWDTLFDQDGKILPEALPPLENSSSDKLLKDSLQTLDKTSTLLTDLSNQVTQALIQP